MRVVWKWWNHDNYAGPNVHQHFIIRRSVGCLWFQHTSKPEMAYQFSDISDIGKYRHFFKYRISYRMEIANFKISDIGRFENIGYRLNQLKWLADIRYLKCDIPTLKCENKNPRNQSKMCPCDVAKAQYTVFLVSHLFWALIWINSGYN